MENIDLQQAFLKQLRVFYGAETHICETLSSMISVAGSRDLKEVLNNHLKVTRGQVNILEKVFESLDETPGGPPSAVITVMLQEEGIFGGASSGNFQDDTDVIIAARKIHHYEMTGFGSLVNLAGRMRDKKLKALLANSEPNKTFPGAGHI